MAVKQILEESPVQPPTTMLIEDVLDYLEHIEPEVDSLDKTLDVCDEMINRLGIKRKTKYFICR